MTNIKELKNLKRKLNFRKEVSKIKLFNTSIDEWIEFFTQIENNEIELSTSYNALTNDFEWYYMIFTMDSGIKHHLFIPSYLRAEFTERYSKKLLFGMFNRGLGRTKILDTKRIESIDEYPLLDNNERKDLIHNIIKESLK